jgi:G:T-mismatch repair DNA endonuclease (very short patch repair protein)
MIIRDSNGRFMKGSISKTKKRGSYLKCKNCKSEFYVQKSAFKFRNPQFCSQKCKGRFLKGSYPKNIPKGSWKKAVIQNTQNGTYKKNSTRMKNGGAIKARKACLSVGPNKPEKKLIKLFKSNKIPLEYCGNGKVWLRFGSKKSFNPDFIDKTNKLIVEYYGDYWHGKKRAADDKLREEVYKNCGYTLIVIWESNFMKNNSKQINRVLKYYEGGVCSTRLI